MRKWILALAVMAVWCAAPAYAQNAQINGTLKDNTGGVLPGVTVTAKNEQTGFTRTTVSQATGKYRLAALPPGEYAISVELSGFKTEERRPVVLVIDQNAIIDFTLQPASISETVTVAGDSPIVDITKSDVSTSVSTQQIQDLPVASRRWIDLAMLTPGTSQDNIRGFFYRGNVNVGGGTREYSNGFVVDGVNNTWAEMGEPRQNFAMDAIQEFKVSTSNYKAEYGLATGGLLTVVTKSGTNQIHGSGLLFFRDASITAREFFQTSKPDYRRYQYGGTFGGPIVKDRTHVFGAFEGTKENQFFTVNARGLWPDYEGTFKSAQDRWTYNVKLDHQLSQSQSLFARWGAENEYRPIITTGGRTTPSASFDFGVPRESLVIGHTWVLSNSSLNDLRFQYAYSKYQVAPPTATATGPPETSRRGSRSARRCSAIRRSRSAAAATRRWARNTATSSRTTSRTWCRAGAGRTSSRPAPTSATFPSRRTAPARRSEAGRSRRTRRTTQPTRPPGRPSTRNSLPTYADIPTKTAAAYLQDDWRVRDGLTLNLGLRYDVQYGSFNEDVASAAREDPGQARTQRHVPRGPVGDPAAALDARRPEQLRPADRHRVGSGRQRHDQRPRGLRHVLRQHADAAEFRRADLAAGPDDHHPQPATSPIRWPASPATPISRRRRPTSP